MPRRPVPIGELATSVLEFIERERLDKTASVSYTKGTPLSTETGQSMQKVALQVRQLSNAPVSYADLHTFRKRYGI